jgi:hypothetical protein
MAVTPADLVLLAEMIASNVLESETADGKRVKFGSMSELRQRYGWLQRYLAGSRGPKVGHVRFEPEVVDDEEL